MVERFRNVAKPRPSHVLAAHRETILDLACQQKAAEAVLYKIGDAVARLPDEFIAAHPMVSWRAMKATRNVVAYRYKQVNYEVIWNALVNRLPAEAELIRDLLHGEPWSA